MIFLLKNFLYNVVPYKDVLPEKLYMELLKTFLKKKVLIKFYQEIDLDI
jgi:hypothetical protein